MGAGGKALVAHDPAGIVFAVALSPNIIKLYDSRSFEKGPFVTFDIKQPYATTDIQSDNTMNDEMKSSNSASASPKELSWSTMKFAPDGSTLLLTSTHSYEWSNPPTHAAQNYSNTIMLIDAFDGVEKQRYRGHEYNPHTSAEGNAAPPSPSLPHSSYSYSSLPFDASFSPDGSFIIAGSRSGNLHAWHTTSGEPVAVFNGSVSSSGIPAPITAVEFCPTKMAFVAADANGNMQWWMPDFNVKPPTH